ncbi:MAG: C-GCAxxG-C-C family protein [Bacteroidales bacterium]
MNVCDNFRIMEDRVEKAIAYFKEGYNCSQAVFMAYADLFDINPELAKAIPTSLGGGMGRLREVCGAVSGMFLLVSMKYPVLNANDKETKKKNYATVQQLAETFSRKNGSIVCRELLQLNVKKEDPTPEDRTEMYYKRRPCVEYVADAVRIFGEMLQKSDN